MNIDKKQLAWYLILGGLGIIAITFLSKFIALLIAHPFLAIALIALGVGGYILVFDSGD
tara:strand:+ start:1206 stop:1382 length:177 start_codon:yes stop_codon:yes gene_type:complete